MCRPASQRIITLRLPNLGGRSNVSVRHPSVIGFLLADDVGTLPADVIENTKYLREKVPHLIPWVCQNWSDPQSLAQVGNPIHCV